MSISEYLRHFYSIVQRSGVNEAAKVEKIHARLDQKLLEISNRKQALGNSSGATKAGLHAQAMLYIILWT
jgi:hypothetical protein